MLSGSCAHRDLVEERRWITREDYTDGLALSQLALETEATDEADQGLAAVAGSPRACSGER